MAKLTEDEVVRFTQAHLAEHDRFTHLARRGKNPRSGADIKVFNDKRHYFIVEAKGETGSSRTDFGVESVYDAVGRLTLRYSSHNGRRYGLAIPNSFRRRVLGKLSHGPVSLMHLHLFVLHQNGRVEHLTPTLLRKLVKTSKPHFRDRPE